jgi:anti-sigma factor RsiW
MSAPDIQRCSEMEGLLAERASGPLEDAEALALDRHLETCLPCRAAAERWETLFSLVALPAPKLKEEAALRGLPERTLLLWQKREQRRRRAPAVVAGGLVAAAAALLLAWHAPVKPVGPSTAPLAVLAEGGSAVQLEWADGPTWEMDEVETSDVSTDDAALLDGLALEGEGAFSLGDSG